MSEVIRLYKFYSSKSALKNLSQQRLKVSILDELNDPFELLNFQIPDRTVRIAWEKTREQLFSDKGLICFSRNWSNPLLWSHYADNHRGLALGFDVPTLYAHKVHYLKERPVLNYKQLSNDERLLMMDRVVRTKFVHWEYEDEYRMILPFSECDYDPELRRYFRNLDEIITLKEVIIGPRSEVTSSQIRKATNNPHLRVVTSRLAFRTFSVVRQNSKTKQK